MLITNRKTRKPKQALAFAGQTVTKEQIQATLHMLRYYRRFLNFCRETREAAAQDENHDGPLFTRCVKYGDWTRREMTEDQVRHHLYWLLDMAINRKAGWPDETMKQQYRTTDWYRDQGALCDIHNRIRVYQFATKQVRARFAHLLSKYND